MINKHVKTNIIIGFLLIVVTSCKYNKADILYPPTNNPSDCSTVAAKYGANIAPIIANNCATAGCHDNSGAGGVVLLNYNQTFLVKDAINTRVLVNKDMPPNGPLPDAELKAIKCWLESGAPNN
jgi:hypothetical protein